MDRKIQDLTHEVDCANRKCEVYRANLLSVLRDIEDHKQQLSVKVQNIKLSMKDGLWRCTAVISCLLSINFFECLYLSKKRFSFTLRWCAHGKGFPVTLSLLDHFISVAKKKKKVPSFQSRTNGLPLLLIFKWFIFHKFSQIMRRFVLEPRHAMAQVGVGCSLADERIRKIYICWFKHLSFVCVIHLDNFPLDYLVVTSNFVNFTLQVKSISVWSACFCRYNRRGTQGAMPMACL